MHRAKRTHLEKIIGPERLPELVQDLRAKKLKIATLNGSFDLLHAGHLHMIQQASEQTDVLVAALNSDDSIRQYKSPDRPIISLRNRLEMMAALEYVDYVTWFEETTPIRLLSMIKPDIHINGSEYGHQCIEAETVIENGGQVHIVDLIPGLSTSGIVAKIQSLRETACG